MIHTAFQLYTTKFKNWNTYYSDSINYGIPVKHNPLIEIAEDAVNELDPLIAKRIKDNSFKPSRFGTFLNELQLIMLIKEDINKIQHTFDLLCTHSEEDKEEELIHSLLDDVDQRSLNWILERQSESRDNSLYEFALRLKKSLESHYIQPDKITR